MNTGEKIYCPEDGDSFVHADDGSDTAVQPQRDRSDDWDSATVFVLKPRTPLFYLTVQGEKPQDILKCPCVVGRSRDADLPLTHESVSRCHAIIDQEPDGTFAVRDQRSLNGTQVDSEAVDKRLLKHGDELKFGSVVVMYDAVCHEPEVEVADAPGKIAFRSRLENLARTSRDRLSSFRLAVIGSTRTLRDSARAASLALIKKIPHSHAAQRRFVIPAALIAGGVVIGLVWFASTLVVANSRVYAVPVAETNQNQAPVPISTVQSKLLPVSIGGGENQETQPTVESVVSVLPPVASKVAIAAENRGSATQADAGQPIETTRSPEPRVVKRKPRQTAAQAIAKAKSRYVSGEFESAVILLTAGGWSANKSVANTLAGLRAAFAEFNAGRKELKKGNKTAAFGHWERFLVAESALLPDGRKSHFAQQVVDIVVDEFTTAGNRASEEERWHDAYANWARAAELRPDSEAARGLSELEHRGKREYLAGYQLEEVQVARAIEHWQQTRRLLPPHAEYHVKAKAKMRLYNVL